MGVFWGFFVEFRQKKKRKKAEKKKGEPQYERKKRNPGSPPTQKQKKRKSKKKKMKQQAQHSGDYGHTPLFGMAYNPLSVSAFGYLSLPTFEFDTSERYTSFM